MPRKTYTEQFKRDAISLYESTPEATVNAIAAVDSERTPAEGWSDAEHIRILERENAKFRE